MANPCAFSTGISAATRVRLSGTIIAARSGRSARGIRRRYPLDRPYAIAHHKPMPTNDGDLRGLDRITVVRSVELVRQAGVADLYRGTPGAGWRLGDLVDHMTA